MLLDIDSSRSEQFELDLGVEGGEPEAVSPPMTSGSRPNLMAALDSLNARYGRGTLKLASAGLGSARAQLDHEAGAAYAGVHHALGGHACGQGVRVTSRQLGGLGLGRKF